MVDVGYYNAQDGQKSRDGGPYLDHVERQRAEVNRARAEGREPADLNGILPPVVGTLLVTAGQVVDNANSNPSMVNAPGIFKTLEDADFDSDNLADPIQFLPTLEDDVVEDEPAVDDGNTEFSE